MCEQAERVTIITPPQPIQHSHARLPWNGWEGDGGEYEYPVVKYTMAGAPVVHKPYVPVFIQLKVGTITEPLVVDVDETLHLSEGKIVCGI